jgi:hypothetical protein
VTDVPSPEVRRGLRESAQKASVEASEVTVGALQENLRGFLNHMDAVISDSPKAVEGLVIDEVEIHVQIDGKGNVGLLGMAKAEIAAQGGIKFVLRKQR